MIVEVLLERCRCAGPVDRVRWFLGAEAFDVDGDRGQDVLDVGLGHSVVAAAASGVR